MERLDHVAELVQHAEGIVDGGVSAVGGEERDRGVAPVVGQSGGSILWIELEHRHQLDRGDPQLLQIRDLLDHAGVGPSPGRIQPAVGMGGESPHVQFVDHGLRKGAAERLIALPVVGSDIGDHALQRIAIVEPGAGRCRAPVVVGDRHGTAVGIEEGLGAIEALPTGRVERTIRPEGIELAGPQPGDEDVPVVIRPVAARVEGDELAGLGVFDVVVQRNLHLSGALGKDAEVDPFWLHRRSQRMRATGLDLVHRSSPAPVRHGPRRRRIGPLMCD